MKIALVLLVAAFSIGCAPSPVELKEDCNGCVASAVLNAPPSAAEEAAALERGRDEAERLCGVRSTATAPRVEYRRCAFVVSSTNFGSNTCVDGLCLYPDRIVVTLWRPGNVLNLVTWEAANWHLLAVGRRDLTMGRATASLRSANLSAASLPPYSDVRILAARSMLLSWLAFLASVQAVVNATVSLRSLYSLRLGKGRRVT